MLNQICIISDDYPYKGRMVDVFVQLLVEALVDDGVKVSVVAPQSITRAIIRGVKLMPRRHEAISANGNKYQVYRPFSLSFSNGNKVLYQFAKSFNQRRIERCLDEINPDIVYGHFWHNAMKGDDYARNHNKPLFVACGEGDDALDNWANRLSEEEKRDVRNHISGVICVSTENKRKCLKYGLCTENNVVVLPNCTNNDVFHPQEGSELRKQLGVAETDFVISFTGAFINRKGSNRLSEAIGVLNSQDVKVIFCGKPLDGYDDNIPKCSGIVHCGPVNHDDLPRYLCASDVFVLPTLKEGCCNAIVEALACGIPVISSNRPFNEDILNDNNALLVDPEDVDAIASAINRLKEDKALYEKLKTYTVQNSSNYSIIERAKKIRSFIESNIH